MNIHADTRHGRSAGPVLTHHRRCWPSAGPALCICLVLAGMSFQVTCNIFFYFTYGGWVRCWGKVWPASLMLEQHCASAGPTSCVCQICAALGRCWFSPTLDEHQLNASRVCFFMYKYAYFNLIICILFFLLISHVM